MLSILDELERAYTADEEGRVAETIAVSLIEMLPQPNAAGSEIVFKLGPRTLAQYKVIFGNTEVDALLARSRK